MIFVRHVTNVSICRAWNVSRLIFFGTKFRLYTKYNANTRRVKRGWLVLDYTFFYGVLRAGYSIGL